MLHFTIYIESHEVNIEYFTEGLYSSIYSTILQFAFSISIGLLAKHRTKDRG
jgi:hypothetical protein